MKKEKEFYVGQLVYVSEENRTLHPAWPRNCKDIIGTFQRVEKVCPDGMCYLKGNGFKWKTSEMDWTKTFELKNFVKSGYRVVDREKREYLVLAESKTLHHLNGTRYAFFNQFTNDFRIFCDKKKDIMKVYNGAELVWERFEKNETQIELEKIEEEMKLLSDQQLALAERVRKLKGE